MTERKYDRAQIIRNEESIPLLKRYDIYEDSHYWLFESKETFHGEYDDKNFYFKDMRIDNRLSLPLSCVELEFTDSLDKAFENLGMIADERSASEPLSGNLAERLQELEKEFYEDSDEFEHLKDIREIECYAEVEDEQ